MAKGKYAARSGRRHEFAGLEERAVIAERERDRLTAELAEVRERADREIAAARKLAADLRRQRDEGAGPAVASLEREIRRVREEAIAELAEARGFRADTRKFIRNLEVFLCERGVCSHLLEARGIICALTQASSLRGMLPPAEEDATRERTATT
jgi:hypothetical protein